MESLFHEKLKDIPIRRKMMFLIMLTCIITIAASSLFYVAREVYRVNMEQQSLSETMGGIIAKNTESALIFKDSKSASETLSSLAGHKDLLAAYLLDDRYAIFAKYQAKSSVRLPLEGLSLDASLEERRHTVNQIISNNSFIFKLRKYLSVVQPVSLDHQVIGYVVIHSDLKEARNSLFWMLAAALLVMAGSTLAAYVLSSRLQSLISRPILDLVDTMKSVSDTKDFRLRASKRGCDEIGLLYDGFNEMLSEIEERNQILHKRQMHLQQLAHFDTLTRLPNRTLFYDRLNQAVRTAERKNEMLAIFFIDLDHFKDINDTRGHRVGDLLLKSVAKRLVTVIRESDTVARLGGDEFTIFAQNILHTENAHIVAKKIVDVFELPFDLEGKKSFVTASVGVTIYPSDGLSADELLKNADIAMYSVKDSGKNSFRQYNQEMNNRANERVVLQNGLREALQNNELVLYYQPKVDLISGKVSSVEALIRWNHPEKGLIPPGRFIPIAEESGLIIPITDWVLQEACRQAMEWSKVGYPDIRVAANISAYHFKRQTVVETVEEALRATGLPARQLEIELTESSLMQNDDYIIDALNSLKRMGATITIDDFGTGYSSLSYLHRFPVDSLKIDRSFVWNMTKSEQDFALVTAIIAMAKSLKMNTVAEGVETKEQVRCLMELGCDEMQGYLISKPKPPEELLKVLESLKNGCPELM